MARYVIFKSILWSCTFSLHHHAVSGPFFLSHAVDMATLVSPPDDSRDYSQSITSYSLGKMYLRHPIRLRCRYKKTQVSL
ncbi:hypothetical protein BJX70DRAFT_380259 [Aspergillus crustosus]